MKQYFNRGEEFDDYLNALDDKGVRLSEVLSTLGLATAELEGMRLGEIPIPFSVFSAVSYRYLYACAKQKQGVDLAFAEKMIKNCEKFTNTLKDYSDKVHGKPKEEVAKK